MAFNIGDMNNLLSELTCNECYKLLSVFPIYNSPNSGYVCGRCTESINRRIVNKSIERNTAYESLAKYLLFPCSNRKFGCYVNLNHDEVVNHENCCNYRPQMCPFNVETLSALPCRWEGAIINLITHLDLSHTSNDISNPFTYKLNMDRTDKEVNCMKFESHTFVIVTRYDGEPTKFNCFVMCCDEEEVCKKYLYQLELSIGEFHLTYPTKNVNVLITTCEALARDDMSIIDVSATNSMFQNLDLHDYSCKISITKKSNEEATGSNTNEAPSSSNSEQKLLQSSKLILDELECPVCNHYMRPPIYICSNGHSLCNECKGQVRECPICRVQSINTRNITLERLTQKVFSPCHYSLDGCRTVLNLDDIGEHEKTCSFRTSNCPLKMLPIACNVKRANVNPISHIYKEHSEDLLRVKKVYSRNLKAAITTSYDVTLSDNNIFIFCCKHSQTIGPVKFNFIHLGMEANVPTYRYRLEFIDKTNLGCKLIVEQVCQALPEDDDHHHIGDAFQNCLTISLDMLKPYIHKKTLFYKFDILKI